MLPARHDDDDDDLIVKKFQFQAIQFTQTIHFSISMLLVLFNP